MSKIILHFNSFGEVTFGKDVVRCRAINVHSSVYFIRQSLEQLKREFARINCQYPISVWKDNDNTMPGNITNSECKQEIQTFLSRLLIYIKKCATHYSQFQADLSTWSEVVPQIVDGYNDLAKRLNEGHRDFLALQGSCAAHIESEGFFLARVKFDRNLTKHLLLLHETKQFHDETTSLLGEIGESLDLVEFSEKLVSFMNMVYEYVTYITKPQELICLVRRAGDVNHRCRGHPHHAIKLAFLSLVKTYNLLPSPTDYLTELLLLSHYLQTVRQNASKAQEFLEDDYKKCLFPVQISINQKIREKEATLGKYQEFD